MEKVREFKKYQHLERFGTDEVQGIEFGTVHIFPKIDGTNGSVWFSGGEPHCGSRRRHLGPYEDNQGFYNYIRGDRRFWEFFKKYPDHRLFGEWLVPHSLKTYRIDAWNKFYVFDVTRDTEQEHTRYEHFDVYSPKLEEFEIDYITPLAIAVNPNNDTIMKALEKNQYLIQDGKGNGEGVVLKNYSFSNQYGRQTWAKVVTTEFKEKHTKEMGAVELKAKLQFEERFVSEFLTDAMIEKTKAKIETQRGGWDSSCIPQLLNTVFHNLVTEETWHAVKKLKNPTIDFKRVQALSNDRVKTLFRELF